MSRIGLSGQDLYSWQTKKQGTTTPKIRQPNGASAPQPSQSGIQNPYAAPKGVSNTMGNPKFGGDMGIYGPAGSQNRQAADQFYDSYQGPMISKAPYRPSENPGKAAPMQQMQGGSQNSMADLYGRMANGGPNAPRQAIPQASNPAMYDVYRPKEEHPDDIVGYHDIARTDGKLQGVTRDGRTVLVDPPARDQIPANEIHQTLPNIIDTNASPDDIVMQHAVDRHDGKISGVTRDGRTVIVDDPNAGKPALQPAMMEPLARPTGQTVPIQDFDTSAFQMNPESTRQDTNSAMNAPGHSAQDWDSLKKTVPQSAFNRFVENYNSGKTQMSPADAALYYQAKYAAPAIGAGAVQGLQKQGQAKVDAANQYYQDTRNLKDVGKPDYSDKNYKTQIANDRIDANNKSMEDQLAHQKSGGGLQANNTTLSNLYGSPTQKEINSRDAALLNADTDRMKSQREEYNTEQDRQFANWRAGQNELYNRQQAPAGSNPDALGLKDGKQASLDIAGLNGQFNAIMKNGQSKGLKFKDFVQNKIDNGELKPTDDVVKIVEKNYGPLEAPSDERALSFVNTWGDPTAAMRDAAAQRREAKQKISDEGMNRRAQIAMQQGNDRMQVANLIGRGYSPAQANAAVAQHNDVANYYGMANNLANADMQSRERIAEGRNRVDLYQTDQMMKDRAEQRKDDQAARLYGQNQARSQQILSAQSEAEKLYPGVDSQSAAQRRAFVEDRIAMLDGRTPPDRLSDAMKAGDNRSDAQSSTLVDTAQGNIDRKDEIDIRNPNAIISVHKEGQKLGLNDKEMLSLYGKKFGIDFSIPSEIPSTTKKILDNIVTEYENTKGNGASYDTIMSQYKPIMQTLYRNMDETQFYKMTNKLPRGLRTAIKNHLGVDVEPVDPMSGYGAGSGGF